MKSTRGPLTLPTLHFPQLFVMLLVVILLTLLVVFWHDVWAFWRRPWA